jgi:hypothetical protein
MLIGIQLVLAEVGSLTLWEAPVGPSVGDLAPILIRDTQASDLRNKTDERILAKEVT